MVSDEILQASQLTAVEFRKEIALYLFQMGRLTNHTVVEKLQENAKLDAGKSEAIALALELNADLL